MLITGGLGYLGGRLADYLVRSGVQVRIGSRRKGGADIVPMDFLDDASLERACQGISTIIHLAAMNAQACEKDPESALLINGLGTLKLLKAAEKEGVSKFLYFSTAHIYGAPLQGKIDEESLPHPLHPYSITHRVAEDYMLEADRKEQLSGIVFRLTNAIGSPLNREANCWMLVVNDLCRQVVTNQRMELYSNESIQRDFLPILTICSAVSFVLEHNTLNGEVVNISSGVALSLRELTDLIADRTEVILGFRPSVHFNQALKIENTEILSISNDKIKEAGFAIDTDLSDEIDQLLRNCKRWFI